MIIAIAHASLFIASVVIRVYNLVDYWDILDIPEYKRQMFYEYSCSNSNSNDIKTTCFPIGFNTRIGCYEMRKCGDSLSIYPSNTVSTQKCTLAEWNTVPFADCMDLRGFPFGTSIFYTTCLNLFLSTIILFITIYDSTHWKQMIQTGQIAGFVENIWTISINIYAHMVRYNLASAILTIVGGIISISIVVAMRVYIERQLELARQARPRTEHEMVLSTYIDYRRPHRYTQQTSTPTTPTTPIHRQPQPVQPVQPAQRSIFRRMREYIRPTNPITHTTQQVAPHSHHININVQTERVQPNEGTICLCCMDTPRNVLFMPCSHICYCSRCAANTMTCPVCRTPVNSQMNVYIA
jgi:hypothetical protein